MRRAPAVVLLVLAAAVSAGADDNPSPGAAQVWFVSPGGDGTTGRSWATAWPELDEIPWSQIGPGDRIEIDGGPTRCPSDVDLDAPDGPALGRDCGVLYRTALTVGASGRRDAPVTVALSTEAGHDGTALLFGGRSTPLPYCNQQDYRPDGSARPAGITVDGRSYVVVDGSHRSGLMVYGAETGVDLASDSTAQVVLRDLEVFDNGTYGTWEHGLRTDSEGISLAGNHITIDRSLIHDNGQDAIQDRGTGVPGTGHAPLHDIRVTNSWLYVRRASPLYPGFGFNSGAQGVPEQDCTHVDGVQVYGGGLHQQRMSFAHDVFGPYLAQGVYPGDADGTSVDHVDVLDTLFLDVLDHSIIGDPIASDDTTPRSWRIDRVTSYQTDEPAPGLRTHGKIDLAGSGHSVTRSIFVNGYFATDSAFTTARNNLWWGGDPVVGGTLTDPGFVGPLPSTSTPSFAELTAAELDPTCAQCVGVGASLHSPGDLLRRIDVLDGRR